MYVLGLTMAFALFKLRIRRILRKLIIFVRENTNLTLTVSIFGSKVYLYNQKAKE